MGGVKKLRLHYYYATPEEVDFLKDKGVEVLFSADDERVSYSLPKVIDRELQKKEIISYRGMNYERTDIRIENTWCPMIGLILNRNDSKIVIFTHEWALQDRINRLKFYMTIYFLGFYCVEFIN